MTRAQLDWEAFSASRPRELAERLTPEEKARREAAIYEPEVTCFDR